MNAIQGLGNTISIHAFVQYKLLDNETGLFKKGTLLKKYGNCWKPFSWVLRLSVTPVKFVKWRDQIPILPSSKKVKDNKICTWSSKQTSWNRTKAGF